jgi:hypothetical protein
MAQPSGGSAARVVLCANEASESLLGRVAAELRSLGFEVVSVSAGSSDDEAVKSLPQLEAVARSSDALAAVQVVAVDGAVDLWIVNVDTTRRTTSTPTRWSFAAWCRPTRQLQRCARSKPCAPA